MTLEDVRKNLKVVAVSGANLEPPWGDVIVPLNEDADFPFA